jgi:hypothetical protein
MKRTHLLAGGLALLSGAALAGGVLWFSSGGSSEEASTQELQSSTPSPSASAAATTSPSPTASPTVIPTIRGPAVVYFRTPQLSYPAPLSELWVSQLDGSGSRRLSPEGAKSTFAGIVSAGDRSLVYYVAFGSGQDRALREADLSSGADREVLAFSGRDDVGGWASVSRDGRYVSFTEIYSIWLFNMQTQERTLLLQGNAPACEGGNAGRCFAYATSQWSPDGRLLLVQKGFYEGAHFVLADPFADQPQIGEFDQLSGAHIAGWAPDSRSVCLAGQYGAPSSLYVAQAPSWSARQFFAEFEQPGQSPADLSVAGCIWPSPSGVAALTWPIGAPPEGQSPPPELVSLNTDTSETSVIASFAEGRGLNPGLVGVPGGSQSVVQFWHGYTGEVAGSFLVDFETGQVNKLLGPGLWVVAMVTP